MSRTETEILKELTASLNLDKWWERLLGQVPSFESFDDQKSAERLPRTELNAAREIKTAFGHTLTYVNSKNTWYIWDGMVHTPCENEYIAVEIVKMYYDSTCKTLEFIEDAIRNQAQKVKANGDPEKSKAVMDKYKTVFGKHREFRDRLSGDAGMTALIRVLRTECAVPGNFYDNDQRWFVMRNYVLDLDELREKGEFKFIKHHPSMAVTRYFDADYVGGEVNHGHWDGFLSKSIPDVESRNYLQKIMGAAFMGESGLRCIPNLVGPPGSGKSLFLGTLYQLSKDGYSRMPDSKAVVKVQGQNFEQDKIRGARFTAVSEPPHGDHIDDDFIKKHSGDVWIETRTLRAISSGWVPQGVIAIAANKNLKIATRDKAIVERVQVIDFPNEFRRDSPNPEYEIDPHLDKKLLEDRSRVLTWIIQGMREFYNSGMILDPPASIKAKQADIVTNGSTALRWIEDYIEEGYLEINHEVDPKYFIKVNDAYMRYNMWAAMAGEKRPLTKRFFLEDIEKKYGEKTVVFHTVYLTGVKVTEKYRSTYESASTLPNDFGYKPKF